jgi:transposase
MTGTTPGQLVDIAGPTLERRCAGRDLVLFCRGLAVASFRQGDSIGRAIAIATLLRVGRGLRTDTIAELCDASHGGVCDVRRRLAEGGVDRVVERARQGAPRKVVGGNEERLREMHGKGATVRELATALGVSKSLIATEIKRLKLPPRAKQEALPMTARGTARASISPVPADGGLAVDETSDDASMGAPSSAPDAPVPPPPEVDGALETAFDVVETAVEALETSDKATLSAVELVAGAPLASGPAEHPCRYAGTLLLCAAAAVLGLFSALDAAHVIRPTEAVYDAHQVFAALMAAWGAGYGSLEAMHERDARALGVILGLERSPSVRTLHRAIAQTSARSDVIELNAALIRGVLHAR